MNDTSAVLFNHDWRFLLGDSPDAESPLYEDRTWKRVDLPHDWVISQPFKRGELGYTQQSMQGYFAWEGVCWYRKRFICNDLPDKETYLYFGGAYRNSVVYVNGRKAGGRAYGYSSFEVNITPFVKRGENCVAVRLDNGCEPPDRWYSGSGLYRNVYLRVVPLLHIKTWGVHVTTKLVNGAARVTVETTLVNHGEAADGVTHTRLFDPAGREVAGADALFTVAGQSATTTRQEFTLEAPLLWSADAPNRYRACVSLEVPTLPSDKASDAPYSLHFGIREIEIAPRQRMKVNGEAVLLKGVCVHHECGILGSAYYDEAWRRRLLTLKSIGCNALRTSHNPPAEEFLDLCDELGFYVIDECFDKWKSGYYEAHFDDEWRTDLEDCIIRDRNHPSIFLWSVGNEIDDQGTDSMLAIQKQLTTAVRALDDRPVTCALAPHAVPRSLVGAPVSLLVERTKKLAEDVDVLALNYHEPLYEAYSVIDKPILGTECYEYYSSVGTNYEDVAKKNPWRFVLENNNVLGQFIWAGIDYLGESGWPAKGWTGSILDICGFLKPNAWYRKSIWTEAPMVYLTFYDATLKPSYTRGRWSFPKSASHLNFPHFIRETVTAALYTNCDEVELRINGKLMGRRRPEHFENNIVEWTFEYAEGEIQAIGYKNNVPVATYTLKTAGTAHDIQLSPDKTRLLPGGIAHIEVAITDEGGILCPNEELLVEFSLTGDGEILGASSPDLNSSLGFTLPKVFTSAGKALLIIKAGASSGELSLNAYSAGLCPATLCFTVSQPTTKD
ncbi:MAG: DUF4982 domain-containing protein [Treponema sp.]|jgi:beta-galactosidase|nr:DUF4982 domain-containing protein [Treponema sp.]